MRYVLVVCHARKKNCEELVGVFKYKHDYKYLLLEDVIWKACKLIK